MSAVGWFVTGFVVWLVLSVPFTMLLAALMAAGKGPASTVPRRASGHSRVPSPERFRVGCADRVRARAARRRAGSS